MISPTKIIHLGSIDQVPVGQGRCFIIDGEEIAVFRSRDGHVFAVENRCPHRGGPLAEGVMGDGKVVCPLHGHKFDLATGQGGEKPECVRIFSVIIDNGEIKIDGRDLAKPQPRSMVRS